MRSEKSSFLWGFIGILLLVIIMLVMFLRVWNAAYMAPRVEYKIIDGTDLSATALDGKVVVLSFWATTCTACVSEIPDLIALHNEYKSQGFEVVAVALAQDKIRSVIRLVDQKKIPYLVAYDAGGLVAQAWGGIDFTPTTFIIDRSGNVVDKIIGSDHMLLQAKIKEHL